MCAKDGTIEIGINIPHFLANHIYKQSVRYYRMQKLVILCAFAAVALADVSHLFDKPSSNLLSPFAPKPVFPAPIPKFVPTPQPYYHGSSGPQIAILRQSQENREDGSYQWAYETANGIAAQEQASVRVLGPEQAIKSAQGSFHYTAPDGTPISLSYVADENGFQPQGAHLPTPPPIPAAILRSLEWNAAHPSREYQEPIAIGRQNPSIFG